MSQLHTASRTVMIKYVGPVVIYKIKELHNYLLMTLYGKILKGLFEHERLKPANIRTSQGNFQNLAQLKQVIYMLDSKFENIERQDLIISNHTFKLVLVSKENTHIYK